MLQKLKMVTITMYISFNASLKGPLCGDLLTELKYKDDKEEEEEEERKSRSVCWCWLISFRTYKVEDRAYYLV